MKCHSVPGVQSYSPALGLGDRLYLFGDVFRLLVDQDAVELEPVARDPIGVAEVDEVWVQYHLVKVKSSVKHNPGKAVGAPFLVS